MAYKTGVVYTASGLLTEIVSLAVGQAGWTLEHDVSTDEKVLKSLGSDGDGLILTRLRTGVKDYNATTYSSAWQNQEFNNAHHEHINISMLQAYNPSGPTIYNEQNGKAGPWLLQIDGWSGSSEGENRTMYGLPDLNEDFNLSPWVNTRVYLWNFYYNNCQAPSHRRRWYGSRRNQDLTVFDFIKSRQAIVFNDVGNNNNSIFAYDESGSPATYFLNSDNTNTPTWYKIVQNTTNISGSGSTAYRIVLAPPPAGATGYQGSDQVWDGKDYIYATRGGYNSSVFYRYQISTNSWSTMANMPGTTANSYRPRNAACYIKKESDIAIEMGWTSDKIIHLRSGSTGARQTYIYDVDSDTWGSLANYPNGWSSASQPTSTWNGRDKIYATPLSDTNLDFYRYSIRNNSWENIGALPFTSGNGGQMMHLSPYQAQITVDINGSNYWIWGDEDRIILVTEDINSGETRFQYFGNIESYYSTQKVTLSSGVSAGNAVTLPISGSADQFVIGHKYYIVDIDGTSGAAESFNLVDTGPGTLTAGSLEFSYGPGAIIGVDPQPAISICNEYDAAFCLHSDKGQGGIEHQVNNVHEQSYIMSVFPADPRLLFASAPGRRGHVQVWPFIVGSYVAPDNDVGANFISNIMAGAGTPKGFASDPRPFEGSEVRGQLKGVYSLAPSNSTNLLGPKAGDKVQVGGNTYLVFRCDNFMDQGIGGGASLIAVGPVV